MPNSTTLREVLRLRVDDDLPELGRRCGENPWFWRWFCHERVAQQLAEWSAPRNRNAAVQWRQPPRLSHDPGQCIVPAVLKPAWEFASAAPAVGLPIAWKRQPHSPLIPHSLRAVADEVKASLAASPTLRERLGRRQRGVKPAGDVAHLQDWGIHWPWVTGKRPT